MDDLQTLTLPLLPLTTGVVLPGMVITIAVESEEAASALAAARDADGRLILVPRREGGRYAGAGTIAVVENAGELPSGVRAVIIRGLQRATVGTGVPGTGDAVWVQVEPVADAEPSPRSLELAREYRAVIENVLEYRGAGQIAEALRGITDPGAMADTAGYSPDLSLEQKIQVLETVDVEARLELVLGWARQTLADLALRDRIRTDVAEGMEKAGLSIPQERWFSNLASTGNTGSAAIYVMLDDLLKSGQVKPGQRLLAFVPESGRFSSCFFQLTAVAHA